MPHEYLPVPVDTARQIGLHFHKDLVVIISYDQDAEMFHTTTYGRTPLFKIAAAKAGEHCTRVVGGDIAKAHYSEDFRTGEGAAKNAQLKDIVLRHLPALKEMAGQILDPRDNLFSRIVQDLESAL